MLFKNTITVLFVFCFSFVMNAQNYKFGKVSKSELEETAHPNDTSTVASYLYKYRKTYYTYNSGVGLGLVTQVHERIKIYDKNGFDYATKKINLSKGSSDREMISGVKGMTFTMENGEIVETKLEKTSIFKSEYSKNLNQVKITMPNVKEGCVLEIKYKITSPYIQSIDEFRFQEAVPIKKLEASMSIFDYFKFNKRHKGTIMLNPKVKSDTNTQLGTNDVITSYSLTDVPALKKEKFVSNIDNYRSGVNFEIVSLQIPGNSYQNFAQTWEDVVTSVYKSSSFGNELKKRNYFEEELDAELVGVTDSKVKMHKVLAFVKNKVKWNKQRGVGTDEGVKKAYKNNTGNSGDINLMLVAMLKHAGFDAYPVLLSTRDNGIPLFPTLQGFNYVIATVKNGDKYTNLDATEKFSAPDVLPLRDINWFGRAVIKDGGSEMVNLMPKIKSVETTMLDLTILDDSSIEGTSKQRFSANYAMSLRGSYLDNTEDKYIENLEGNYDDVEISNFEIRAEEDPTKPLSQSFDVLKEDSVEEVGDKLHFSPLFYLSTEESPFKSSKREFPIDFGYPWEDRYMVKIKLPEGYQVESLPENIYFSLPEKMGSFKFNISNSGNTIQVSSTISFTSSVIVPEHYGAVQEFYRQVIKKQTEKVVLSKI
jgi:hypothetical protein